MDVSFCILSMLHNTLLNSHEQSRALLSLEYPSSTRQAPRILQHFLTRALLAHCCLVASCIASVLAAAQVSPMPVAMRACGQIFAGAVQQPGMGCRSVCPRLRSSQRVSSGQQGCSLGALPAKPSMTAVSATEAEEGLQGTQTAGGPTIAAIVTGAAGNASGRNPNNWAPCRTARPEAWALLHACRTCTRRCCRYPTSVRTKGSSHFHGCLPFWPQKKQPVETLLTQGLPRACLSC